MKIIYEIPWQPQPQVQVEYLPTRSEYRCFGLSCGVPQPGDQIQAYGGPRFVIIYAESYGSGFQGTCKEVK